MTDLPEVLIEEFEKAAEEAKLTKADKEKVMKRLMQEYERAKINPGEAIGVVTAESFGEPGTQMSVSTNEWLQIKMKNKVFGDKIYIVKAGEFVDKLMDIFSYYKLNESDILDVRHFDIYAPSLNEHEKMEWKQVVELSRHKTNKDLLKLTTRTGRTITATDNHSFVTRKNNSIVPIVGRELKIGDRIPVVRSLPVENPLKEIEVVNSKVIYEENLVVENGLILKTNTNSIPESLELDELTGWFIGAYLAEGHSITTAVSISNLNDNYINNAKKFLGRIKLNYNDRFYQGEYGPGRTITTSSKLLAGFIERNCNKGADNKKVPDFAFNASDEFVSGMLRAYFDGDGNFHVDRKMIRASSNSEKLIKGIALLLNRFGIFSYKTKDKKNQHWLLIPYKYAPVFLDKIGSDIEYKKEALEKLSKLAEKLNDKSQDYNEMISGFDDLFYRTAKKVGMPTRYVNNFTKRQKIGKIALSRYIEKFEKLAREKNIDINNELGIMKTMNNSDVVWDEIVKMEYVKPENDYVYDLAVPGLETFTTFDEIVTHNTLNVFHFAGVAEMGVTTGLPRLIELFDARKETSTPSMEVYLKKEYNKEIKDAKKVAAIIKEVKFRELISEFSINVLKMQVEATLNKKNMKELGITEKFLAEVLTKAMPKTDIKTQQTVDLVLKPVAQEYDLREVYKLKEKAKEAHIRGIKGITQVLPVKQEGEFVILTTGSNLKDVLELEEVDITRTITNSIHEVAEVLGIEAAREAIITEASKVIKQQGLEVDIRHLMLIADLMTVNGVVRGVTRSGITSDKESVLARASFETPIRHIINASMAGEEDFLNSVIENVLLNQPVPLGTGLPGLIAKMKKEKNG